MARRAAEAAGVSAIALILTLAMAAPVLRRPSERIFGAAIVGRHHDPFTVMQQFARPMTLGIYSQPLTDIPGAWLARLSGPVAAYNWLVLLTFPLSAAAAFLLARYLRLSPAAALVAAIAYAFSPFHVAQAAYHPHIAQTQWIPLYLLVLWRCLDEATVAAVCLLAAAIAGVALSNFYGGFIAAVVTPAAVAAAWFVGPRREARPLRSLAITIGTLCVAAAAGLAYAWYAARAVALNQVAFGFLRDDLFRFSAKWWSYVLPPVEHPLLGRFAGRVWSDAGVHDGLLEQQVSLGWGIVLLGFVAVFFWIQERRTDRRVPLLALVGFVALVCSLSPERVIGPFTFVRPSAWLYTVAPMFRAYARFGVVVQLMAVMLAGIGAERLWHQRHRSRIVCAALLTLVAFDYAVWPPDLSRDVLPTPAHRWVMRQPGPLHAFDCRPLTAETGSIPWLTSNRISLMGGSFDDCDEPNLSGKLSAAGYTHLLVNGTVFPISTPVPMVYTERMTSFYGREYDTVSSWRWMGPDASWSVVNRTDRPILAGVNVEMAAFHNDRRLTLLLDGLVVQTLTIEERRRANRIGPYTLTPGSHQLVFQPADPPTVADAVMNNGDERPLSFAIGTWHWTVEGERP